MKQIIIPYFLLLTLGITTQACALHTNFKVDQENYVGGRENYIGGREKHVGSPETSDHQEGFIPQVKILELTEKDPDQAAPLTAIAARLEKQPLISANEPNYGFSKSVFWIGLELTSQALGAQQYFLELAYSRLDSVYFQVIDVDTSKTLNTFSTGDKKPFLERPYLHPNFVLPLELETGQKVRIYIRVQTTSSSQFPIRIWTQQNFNKSLQLVSSLIGGLIGVVALMAVYNLFLFISLSDRSYLYFSITLAGYALVEAMLAGLAYQYFWPSSPGWNDVSLVVISNIALASLVLFSHNFLAIKVNLRQLSRLFYLLALIGFILAVISLFLPYEDMILITSANVIISPALGYLVGLFLSFRNYKPAKYYNLAFTFFVIAAAAFTMSKAGYIPRNFFTEYGIHIAAVTAVLLLSFAMADRIHFERRARETAQLSAIESLQKYRGIYEKSLEGMFRVLLDGTLLACNPAFAKLLGAENETGLLAQVSSTKNLIPAHKQASKKLLGLLEENSHIFAFETKCRRLDGSEFWGAIFANRLEDSEHNVIIEGSIVDITDKKENELQLSYLATHDPLTNLQNRTEFEKQLRRALTSTRDGSKEHALIFIDLDQFKIVNDTSGHIAGDELLRQIGSLFHSHIREHDCLARMGGDEFALLLKECGLEKATEIGNRLRTEVAEYRFIWGSKVFTVGASIGIVPVSQGASSVEEIMSLADTACYAAKDAGRNRVIVHSHNTSHLQQRQNEMQVATNLLEAIKADNLKLFYQDVITTRPDVKGQHYEILVRMEQDGKIIGPGAFLPAAERYNMIRALDRWVIESYFKWLSLHPQHMESLHQVNINLSSQTIGEADFEEFLRGCLEEYRIPAYKICFEVTETTAISNMVETAKFMQRMQDSGVKFALDDFGSGFSSYSYLKTLPVNCVKIDGSFIKDILEDPIDHAMVRSITEVAHLMGLTVVAEFVENGEIQQALEEIGVDFMQGYHLHVPEALQ